MSKDVERFYVTCSSCKSTDIDATIKLNTHAKMFKIRFTCNNCNRTEVTEFPAVPDE